MASITLRIPKGSPLTNLEVDNNFANLNTYKTEIGGDISGNVLAPTVSRIQGRQVSNVAPANAQAYVWISGNNQWEPGNVVGIAHFVETNNILYSYSAFTATDITNVNVNIDAVFSPKGTGASVAHITTNDATGGDKRGEYATDFQKHRSVKEQVASGNYSVIVGGRNNKASGLHSSILSGIDNEASGSYSVNVSGAESKASGTYSSTLGGYQSNANSNYSTVIGGRKGTSRGITGYTVFPANNIPIANEEGASQAGLLVLGTETDSSFKKSLTSDSGSPAYTNQFYPAYNTTVGVRGLVVARQVGGINGSPGDSRVWSFEGSVSKSSNGVLSVVGEIVIHKLPETANTLYWDIEVISQSGILKVNVTGENDKTIRWVCRLDTVEVGN